MPLPPSYFSFLVRKTTDRFLKLSLMSSPTQAPDSRDFFFCLFLRYVFIFFVFLTAVSIARTGSRQEGFDSSALSQNCHCKRETASSKFANQVIRVVEVDLFEYTKSFFTIFRPIILPLFHSQSSSPTHISLSVLA